MVHHRPVATRVLVVEDDDRIRKSLLLALEDEGYEVDEASDAEQALHVHTRSSPDVVLVDLMLPGMNGFDLCRELRKTSGVPIVVVTARSDTHDVVAGLEAGADDYVTKPFAVKELTARIRSLLRRSSSGPGAADTLRFGALEIQPEAGLVRRDGDDVGLTKTEFRLLCELASHPGIVMSREQLLERVWGYDYFGDARLVDAHIRRLRTKIERDPSEPDLVVTVRGLGYKLQP
jgi:DNA-binding response OmpR family regulator